MSQGQSHGRIAGAEDVAVRPVRGRRPDLSALHEDAFVRKAATMLVYAWMLSLQSRLQSRFEEDRGATAVEYGLLVGLIAVVIIAMVALLGQRLNEMFANVVKQLGG